MGTRGQPVRGVVVVGRRDPKLAYSVRAIPNLSIKCFSVSLQSYSGEDIDLEGSGLQAWPNVAPDAPKGDAPVNARSLGAGEKAAATRNMKIYASLESDISEGFVWLKKTGLPARCVVKIRNTENRHSVFCEALQFDANLLTRYNEPSRATIKDPESSIVMSGWYRARLG